MPLTRIDPAWVLKLVSAIASVTWTATGTGYVLDIPQWCALTGQSPEEAKGEGWLGAVPKEDVDRVQSAWRTAVSHASEYKLTFVFFAQTASIGGSMPGASDTCRGRHGAELGGVLLPVAASIVWRRYPRSISGSWGRSD